MLTNFAHLSGKTDPVILGAQIALIGGIIAVALVITILGRWRWLWYEWLTSLNPKRIGVMYLIVAFLMLLRGAVDAFMLRLQQTIGSGGGEGFLDANHFQQVFTAHGTLMIFFVAMGLMFGIINLILPLQIGSRDVAFPFLNSLSFWLYLVGVGIINTHLIVGGEFAATGWLAYPPLSGIEYSPGPGVDYWIWSVQIAGIGSLLSGVNFFTTILKLRRKGMTLMRMPIFAWSVLGSMTLVLFTFPILTVALALLALDRTFAMHFFTSSFGGNPMMYINLIWAWGHPEVYILILPAFGIFSEIVATFSKKRLFGYTSMVWAIIAITFLSYIVWLHHFFTMGAGANVNAFFGIATMVIAIPTGVKVFNWLFTMYKGRVRMSQSMIWFIGFLFTFTLGGMTGVILSIPPADFQLHNSLFLVAHFHNMVIGGVVFGYMAGLTYWFPKMFGFKLHEGLGKAAAWSWIIGFLVAFIPIYMLGLMGGTRRFEKFDPSLGYHPLFVVAGIGVVIIGIGVVLQVTQLIYSILNNKKLADKTGDPWDGRTLEWSVSSPAPEYNFARLDEVNYRDEYWERKKTPAADLVKYKDIEIPKGSPIGMFIGIFAYLFAMAVIWHIAWIAALSIVIISAFVVARLNDDDIVKTIKASQIEKIESSYGGM
ncbi:cbb3-type cytochrome c oxidase subunit I [Candidatus Saccharibacteria bacterium]|nr:cbb3-type cytochrome c oxidase subunit I [Candidatus Saccharibacteria bacterium]